MGVYVGMLVNTQYYAKLEPVKAFYIATGTNGSNDLFNALYGAVFGLLYM